MPGNFLNIWPLSRSTVSTLSVHLDADLRVLDPLPADAALHRLVAFDFVIDDLGRNDRALRRLFAFDSSSLISATMMLLFASLPSIHHL
jgi:hypothetical protein